MSYIFGKLWHLAIIWAIRKAFQCILQGVRFLLSNHTRLSPTSDNDSYIIFDWGHLWNSEWYRKKTLQNLSCSSPLPCTPQCPTSNECSLCSSRPGLSMRAIMLNVDIYEISLIQCQGWNLKIVVKRFFVTPPYFCWQLAFYRHLPTSGRQNTVKTAPQPLIVNKAFFALYVGIILPIGPTPISLFLFDPVLPARSWEMPVERELPAKIGRCYEKPYGHNFQISALKLNQRYFVYIKIPLIQFQGWNMKIVAVRLFGTPF